MREESEGAEHQCWTSPFRNISICVSPSQMETSRAATRRTPTSRSLIPAFLRGSCRCAARFQPNFHRQHFQDSWQDWGVWLAGSYTGEPSLSQYFTVVPFSSFFITFIELLKIFHQVTFTAITLLVFKYVILARPLHFPVRNTA